MTLSTYKPLFKGTVQKSGIAVSNATVLDGFGALANVGVAAALYDYYTGWAMPALAGILVGTIWNFVVSGKAVWNS